MAIRLGLLTADLGAAGTGINNAVRGIVQTSEGDVEAFVKRLTDPREILVESICALLGRHLKLPVPEPLLVFVPEELGGPGLAFGSAAVGHPNLHAWVQPGTHQAVTERLRAWPDLIPSACFDEWIANCDRHGKNVLFDGRAQFWLIDHGLAVNPSIQPDTLAPDNVLFRFAVDGQPESDLLLMRPKALGVMQSFAEEAANDVVGDLPSGFWSLGLRDQVMAWLVERQNHLLRLGDARIPAQQGELFNGGAN